MKYAEDIKIPLKIKLNPIKYFSIRKKLKALHILQETFASLSDEEKEDFKRTALRTEWK